MEPTREQIRESCQRSLDDNGFVIVALQGYGSAPKIGDVIYIEDAECDSVVIGFATYDETVQHASKYAPWVTPHPSDIHVKTVAE